MDVFARALVIADKILQHGEYSNIRKERYASYDSGKGAEFEAGKLSLEDLRQYAIDNGEPKNHKRQTGVPGESLSTGLFNHKTDCLKEKRFSESMSTKPFKFLRE
jgi:xylose isomerase